MSGMSTGMSLNWRGIVLRRLSTLLVAAALTAGVSGVSSAKWVYVASYGAATPGTEARGVAVTNDGRAVYLAGVHDKKIWKYDTANGTLLAEVDLTGLEPAAWGKAVFIDRDGDVWAPATAPTLLRFDAGLQPKMVADLSPFGIVQPEGVVVDPYGSVYVSDRKGKGGVYKFHLQGGKLMPAGDWGSGGHVPVGADVRQLAITPEGDVVLGSFEGGSGSEIFRINGKTGQVTRLAQGVARPYHVATDAAGMIYVAQFDNPSDKLTLLDGAGKVLGRWRGEELGLATECAGVAVSPDGQMLYLVDQTRETGGEVRVYRWEG